MSDVETAGFGDRFATLWPALEPGGSYEVGGCRQPVRDAASFAQEYLDGGRKETVAFLVRTVSQVVSDSEVVTLSKSVYRHQRMHAVSQRQASAHRVELLPAAFYRREAPLIVGSPVKERMARDAHRDYQPQFVPAQFLSALGECFVSGYGNVHPSEGAVVEESFANSWHTTTRGLLQRNGDTDWWTSVQDVTPRQGVAVEKPCIILKQTWDANYGHWLVDNFARLARVGEYLDLGEVSVLVNDVPEPMHGVMVQCMNLLGIGKDQIVVQGTHSIHLAEAYYPGPVSRAPSMKHPQAVDFLRSLVPLAAEAGGRNHAPSGKVYLSRNRTGKRMLTNEDELVPHLVKQGYEVVYPEELCLYDQMCTLGGARHVVGNMGAALTNLVFSPPGVNMVALATPGMSHDYFYDIVSLKQGRYVGIQASGASNTPLTADFSLEVNSVLDVLASEGFLDGGARARSMEGVTQ
ncbi:glycosyltransferase family 61 protein [Luteococcus sp. Sow4_B9]|uniref:glycosyltransferase family 61 protein n=1 Tax=Luteococcus sp. Sow4_B9 TaxID=3438792 RepID=UPI003F98BA6A